MQIYKSDSFKITSLTSTLMVLITLTIILLYLVPFDMWDPLLHSSKQHKRCNIWMRISIFMYS